MDPGSTAPSALPGSVRVVHAHWDGSSWLARCVIASAMAVLIILALLLLVPVLVVGAAVLLAAGIRGGVRRLLTSIREPNGALDGRKNVRVILPGDRPPG